MGLGGGKGRRLPKQHYFVEYSREGSKVDGANPSEAVLGIWVCNVPLWEHQSSALLACSVPLRNTRPREHEAPSFGRQNDQNVITLSWPMSK